jgi:hypothetical protein
VATDGRLVAEGAPPGSDAVSLGDTRSAIVIDLGSTRVVGALRVQASADDTYFVEASGDGAAWRVAWRVAPLPGVPGLRTRTTKLRPPVSARWLRVRSTTSRAAAVSEIEAFALTPAGWAPLDLSRPDSPLPLWPRLTHDKVMTLYTALAALLMLAVGWSAIARGHAESAGAARARRGALFALAAAALLAWPNFLNFHYYGLVHKWEFFHYYMGAKYLPELGYTRLYACAAAVDAEDGIDLGGRLMRDLRDNRLVPAEAELARAAECRSRFSEARGNEFRRDVRFFRAAMGAEDFAAARHDHGFNGTPAWAVLAGALTRLAPASWPQVGLLALLDVALLAAAFAVIGRSFGLEAACVAAGYFGVNALAVFGWTGGGLLRYDWLFLLVAGVAALRARRPLLAGLALGGASLLRVFPACAIAAVALKAAGEAVAERSLRPFARRGRLAAGVAAAVVVLHGGSALMSGRMEIWREFAANSAKHLAAEASNFVGLGVFLAHEHEGRLEMMTDPLLPDPHAAWKTRLSAAERETRPGTWAAGAAFVLLLALAVRGVPEWTAAVLGVGLVPMLLKLSGYYYSALLVYAALWPVSPAAGLALASFAWATNVIAALWSSPDERHAWLSLATVILVTGLTAAFAWRKRPPPDAPAGGAGPSPPPPPG